MLPNEMHTGLPRVPSPSQQWKRGQAAGAPLPETLFVLTPLEGKIKTVTIKKEVDQWYVTFSCEVAEAEKFPVSYEDVGIDLGVSHLATLSNGVMIEHPRYYRRAKKHLEVAHQKVSRGKKGSHRRNKAKQAEEAGRTLFKVSPKFTSQVCSTCGTVRQKDLSERWHSCDCGAELDRDVNAALNILARGHNTLSGGTRPTLSQA